MAWAVAGRHLAKQLRGAALGVHRAQRAQLANRQRARRADALGSLGRAARLTARHVTSAASDAVSASITLDDAEVVLGPRALAGATILEACEEVGRSLPHECRQGTCGRCEVDVRLGGEPADEVFRVLACREPVVPGMLITTLVQQKGPGSITARLRDPDASADLCIGRLQHEVEGLPGVPPGCACCIAKEQARRLLETVPHKKWHQLLEGKEAVILDGFGLDDFGALVVARLCRRAAQGDGAGGSQGGKVRSLSLNGNPDIGASGAGHLARTLLASDHPMRSLFLTDCGLGDEGAVAVAEAVHRSETLMILELRKNGITAEGALAMAKALRHNGSLTNVYLSKNEIDDDGAMALSKAILWRPESAPKVKVWLQMNPVSEPTRERISIVLGKNIVKW